MDVLEQIRLLTNLDIARSFSRLFIGQPELLSILRQRLHSSPSASRPDIISGPVKRETYAYIRHRLSVAGGEAALQRLGAAQCTGRGRPRLINIIGDRALRRLRSGQSWSTPPSSVALPMKRGADPGTGRFVPMVEALLCWL
jgi:type II secretory pathway predicted ATPase ExeA